jgi:hypothetical protein
MTAPTNRIGTLAVIALCAVGVSACAGQSTSTSSFKGQQHAVAQTVADLQSAATAGEASKICKQILAAALVARLNAGGGCKQAIKRQLEEVDNFEVTVQSVALGPGTASQTATAAVKSVKGGKTHPSTLTLVKESGKWRISGLG